jgi:putative transcriptional regulator
MVKKSDRATDFNLGDALLEGLQEVRDWKAGKLALEVVNIPAMAAAEVIRKAVASSAKAFEARFGIPAGTLNNWEQGRREPDVTARLLLRVIAAAPLVVEQAARGVTRKRTRGTV